MTNTRLSSKKVRNVTEYLIAQLTVLPFRHHSSSGRRKIGLGTEGEVSEKDENESEKDYLCIISDFTLIYRIRNSRKVYEKNKS